MLPFSCAGGRAAPPAAQLCSSICTPSCGVAAHGRAPLAARPAPSSSRGPGRRRPVAPTPAAPAPDSGLAGSTEASLLSETERFVMELSAEEAVAAAAAAAPPPTAQSSELQAQLAALQSQVGIQLASLCAVG